MTAADLLLAEELLLLGSRQEDGRLLLDDTVLDHALTGARLAELAISGRVTVVGGDIQVIDQEPVGDEELDRLLVRVQAQSKPRRPVWWVGNRSTTLRPRLTDRLVARGALIEQKYRAAGILPATRYQPEPGMRQSVLDRLTAVADGVTPDERTGVLLSLVRACGLDRKLFTAEQRQRIDGVVEDNWAGNAVQVVRAVATTGTTVATVLTNFP